MNNVYLLYGDDNFLIEKKVNDIVLNNEIIKYDLNEVNIREVIEDLLMPSLFSEKKYIVCYNVLFLSSIKSDIDHDFDYFNNYLNHDNENVLILIVPSKLDERKKIVKEIKNNVKSFECFKLNSDNLSDYTKEIFKNNGYNINHLTVNKFLEKVGNNLYNIHNEINKLLLYKLAEKTISDEDIENLTSRQTVFDIFELVNAIITKNKEKAMEAYYELLKYNEEPVKIIVMVANEFRLMYQTKILRGNGYFEKDIAKMLEVHPYRIKLAIEKSFQYEKHELVNIIESLANLDIEIKRGYLNKNIALDLFILGL